MARNILAIYLECSDTQRAAGAEWYAEEHARLVDFAQRHGMTVTAAAGAASAISPGMRWEFVHAHLAALRKNPRHSVPTYCRAFVEKAVAILGGRDPLEVLIGPKTRAFFQLLRDPHTSGPVVVDGHALNIARGVPTPIRGDQVPAAGRVTAARYRRAAAAYREVAELCGAAPHHVQAATWIYWRDALDAARGRKAEG
jgi:hypothetical protein